MRICCWGELSKFRTDFKIGGLCFLLQKNGHHDWRSVREHDQSVSLVRHHPILSRRPDLVCGRGQTGSNVDECVCDIHPDHLVGGHRDAECVRNVFVLRGKRGECLQAERTMGHDAITLFVLGPEQPLQSEENLYEDFCGQPICLRHPFQCGLQ
jgi:hypothetical protein